ncbi:thioredoxin [uncultured Clostridium sp.]|uniref:thioredoxin n=1 Tax=uncultured Clostridium sp. TaxID=59620 RepID=UPI0026226BCF|nr:thioredoxin [uncultured Clostridium sp.]
MTMHINDSNFKEEVLESKGLVLVDFFATWCGPCKMIAPILEELDTELSDVKIVKVDVDQSPETANTYGIQSIPTMKLFKDGKDVQTTVGFLPKDQIVSMINNHR